MAQEAWDLAYATDEMKADVLVVLQAVQHNGMALKHAADELRCNRRVVLAAVTQHAGRACDEAPRKGH